MPPTLALLLCTIFVAAILWIDYRHSWKSSLAIWVPTLWLIYCASRPLGVWFQGGSLSDEEMAVAEGSFLDRTTLSILIVLGLIILLKRKIQWSQVFRDNSWLIIMFLYMLVSILWSDFPYVSFKRWVKTAGTLIMALVVFTEEEPLESLQNIIRRTAYILIPFSLMLAKYYPHYGVQFGRWSGATSWCGVSLTKNTLGALCMVSIFFLIWDLVRKNRPTGLKLIWYQKVATLIVLGWSLWLLRGPGGVISSATSFGVLIIGFSTFFFLRMLKNKIRSLISVTWLGLIGIILILFIINAVLDKPLFAYITSLMGRDETLTGRTDLIWSKLIPIALQNPFFGVGYGAFWIKPIFEFTINEAHNGYLDVFIELGTAGLLLLLLVIFSYFKKTSLAFDSDRDWANLSLSFLLIVLLHNITETSFLRSTMLIWNIFIFLMVGSRTGNFKMKEEKIQIN
jgi:exopolysaccharide production protein ExoQ